MGIILTIIIGFVVGLLARAIMPGTQKLGIILTTLLGIGGALVAAFLGQAVGLYEPGQPAGFIGSVIGAILVLWVYGLIKRKT